MATNISLVVVHGKPSGKVLRLPRGRHMIGRGPECQLRPNSEWISRQHCMLTVDDDSVCVRDLGSTNGTLVNGRRITEETPLQHGDVMLLGSLALRLDVVLDAASAGPGSAKPALFGTTPAPAGKTIEYTLDAASKTPA